jgi:hypothetical protein
MMAVLRHGTKRTPPAALSVRACWPAPHEGMMRQGWKFLAVIAIAASAHGVSAAEAPDIVFGAPQYSPPKAVPGRTFVTEIPASMEDAEARATASLIAGGYSVLGSEGDGAGITITAYYTGGPHTFVDCGVVSVINKLTPEGRPATFDGAGDWAVYGLVEQDQRYIVDRQLEMHARVVVQLTPAGGNTHAEVDIQYVLANVSAAYLLGRKVGTSVETLEFTSSTMGTSAQGLSCVSTGSLERQTLDLIRA